MKSAYLVLKGRQRFVPDLLFEDKYPDEMNILKALVLWLRYRPSGTSFAGGLLPAEQFVVDVTAARPLLA